MSARSRCPSSYSDRTCGEVTTVGDKRNLPRACARPLIDSLQSQAETKVVPVRAGEGSRFHSEVLVTFSRQGKCPPVIGHLVIFGAKEITGYEVTHAEGKSTGKIP